MRLSIHFEITKQNQTLANLTTPNIKHKFHFIFTSSIRPNAMLYRRKALISTFLHQD
jgi:hypothetical protein